MKRRKIRLNIPLPKTRAQEVLYLMLDYRDSITNIFVSLLVANVNAHKVRQYWKDHGVQFKSKRLEYINVFGRRTMCKEYRIVNRREAIMAYKRSFKR